MIKLKVCSECRLAANYDASACKCGYSFPDDMLPTTPSKSDFWWLCSALIWVSYQGITIRRLADYASWKLISEWTVDGIPVKRPSIWWQLGQRKWIAYRPAKEREVRFSELLDDLMLIKGPMFSGYPRGFDDHVDQIGYPGELGIKIDMY